MTEPFVLDSDVFIPTGVPATPQQVAGMIVDPAHPMTEGLVPALIEDQQPTSAQIEDARRAYAAPTPLPAQEDTP